MKDGTTDIEELGLERLDGLAKLSQRGFWELMNKPWIRDDFTWVEYQVLSSLRIVALYRPGTRSDEVIIQVLGMPFLGSVEENDLDVMQTLKTLAAVSHDLLHQSLSGLRSGPGITDDQAEFAPLLLMEPYDAVAAEAIRALPWAKDGITGAEVNLAVDLQVLAAESPEVFWVLVDKAWMQNITMLTSDFEHLVRSFRVIATGPGRDRSSALQIARMPFLETFDRFDSRVTRTLSAIHLRDPGSLSQVLSDPRLSAGITDGTARVVSQIDLERRRASDP